MGVIGADGNRLEGSFSLSEGNGFPSVPTSTFLSLACLNLFWDLGPLPNFGSE